MFPSFTLFVYVLVETQVTSIQSKMKLITHQYFLMAYYILQNRVKYLKGTKLNDMHQIDKKKQVEFFNK